MRRVVLGTYSDDLLQDPCSLRKTTSLDQSSGVTESVFRRIGPNLRRSFIKLERPRGIVGAIRSAKTPEQHRVTRIFFEQLFEGLACDGWVGAVCCLDLF